MIPTDRVSEQALAGVASVRHDTVQPLLKARCALAAADSTGVFILNAKLTAGAIVWVVGDIQRGKVVEFVYFNALSRSGLMIAPSHEIDAAILPARPKDLMRLQDLIAERLRPTCSDARGKVIARAVVDYDESLLVVGISNDSHVRPTDVLNPKPIAEPRQGFCFGFSVFPDLAFNDSHVTVGKVLIGRVFARSNRFL